MRGIIGILACLFLLFAAVDCGGGETRSLQGEVIDRAYIPEHTSYSTDSKGRLHTQWTPDDYTIIVRGWDGIRKVDTNMAGYYSVEKGKKITYKAREGWISHHLWSPTYYID